MENITLDFFGEKITIIKPKDLSFLRILISEKFLLSDVDAAEILIYYIKDNKKHFIINDEDYLNFINLKISIIYLDIDPKSELYLNNKKKIEKENSTKSNEKESNDELEKLIQKKKEIEKLEEEYLKSYKAKLTNLNKQIDMLLAQKLDLVTMKKNKIKEIGAQKEKINKKISEISENKEILEENSKKENKDETNLLSFDKFNKVKEVLENVVEKVKDVTNEYIFKNFEQTKKEDKIDNIKKTTKDAIEEINNLSRLVINQSSNLIEEINGNEEEKIILKGAGRRLGANEESSDLCESCVNKNKRKLNHVSIKVKEGDNENVKVLRGVKCKGCGCIIWEEN